MFKISIILPTFNVEDYLKRAFDSLLGQTIGFSNIQIIFIDDCSTDSSCKLIDEYANKYKNVLSIHLSENSGAAGKPRNIGIKYALADYLLFLDPDDYLLEDACEVLYEKIIESRADIVVGGYAKNKEWVVPWNSYFKNNISFIKNPSTNISIFMNPPGLAAKLFKKDLILGNNIKFPEKIPAQDLVFITECFLNAKSVLSLNDFIVYCYYQRNDEKSKSISNEVTKKYLHNILKAYSLTLELLEKFNVDDNLRNIYFSKHHISFFVSQLQRSNLNNDEIVQLFNSHEFSIFKNQNYINDNERLKIFFQKIINDYHSCDISELDEIWRSAVTDYVESDNFVPEIPFHGDTSTHLIYDSKMEKIEHKINEHFKKNAKLTNILNK